MIVLKCKECGKALLTTDKERKYIEGKKITNEGCVINPKIINGKEYRRVKCYDCFEKKYGRKPKQLNTVCYDMCYLMDISENEIKRHRETVNAITKHNMIKKYGEEKGEIKWNEYRHKQAKTNSFEYKKQKYGWTKEQFDDYNNERAITLKNCIKRHGNENGPKVFDEYCRKQSYAGCKKEYFIEKYGEIKGIERYEEVNKQKSMSITNFIRKYGSKIGKEKFEEWLFREITSNSKVANELFNKLNTFLPQYKTYCAENRGEYGIWLHDINSYVKLDFFVFELNKGIELYGNYWHCHKDMYSENYYHTKRKKTAQEIWNYDHKRNNAIYDEYKIELLTIWESDYNSNKEEIIKKCLLFLGVKI